MSDPWLPTRLLSRAAAKSGGFTLVEVLFALGIMAVAMTSAIGLFAMATSTHKRAIDETNSALLADLAIAELSRNLTLRFDASGLDRLPVDPGGALATSSGAAAAPAPVIVWRRAWKSAAYPGYACDVLLTPVGGPDPAEADAFHVEVRIRWLASGRERGETYHTVLLRRLGLRDERAER